MGGNTLYFGEIGESSKTLINYFERNGARKCHADENPAEWILEVTTAAPEAESPKDWPSAWRNSDERQAIKAKLAIMRETGAQQPVSINSSELDPFANPFNVQLKAVLVRAYQQYWRTPSYLYSKVALCLFSVSFFPCKQNL